jgi:hypothetical protein
MTQISEVAQFPVLDREAARTLLQYLDPDTDEFTFQTFTDSEARRKAFGANPGTKKRGDPLARTLHGTLDQHWTMLAELSRNGAGVFVTVNRTNLRGRRIAENVVAVRAYFADFDDVGPETIKANLLRLGLMPHLIVQSSASKWHVYWFVDDASLGEFGATQEKLSEVLGSDPGVKDLPRVMRLAGFIHQKDAAKISLVKIAHKYDGDNYTNADFQTALARALTARQPRQPLHVAITSGLGKSTPDWSEGYAEGQRNNECARRAGYCFARGMSAEATLEECLRWNEKNNPPLADSEVEATVASIARREARKRDAVASIGETQVVSADPEFVFDGDAPIEPPPMLIKKLLPVSGIAFIGGQSSVGKTYVAVALGVALASGKEFFKYQVRERIGALYIAAEGAGNFGARVSAAKLVADIKGPIPFAWTHIVPPLQTQPELTAFIHKLQVLGREMQQRWGVRLGAVFIDTVAACFSMQDENSNAEVSRVCASMRYISDSIGLAVIPIHHFGKDAGTGLRGASAWRGAADVVISVTGDIDPLSGRTHNRALAIAKARDAEQGPIAPFRLDYVKLGVDKDGEEFGTCVVRDDPERTKNVARNQAAPKWVPVFDIACKRALSEHGEELIMNRGKVKPWSLGTSERISAAST